MREEHRNAETHDGETADRFRSQLPLIRVGFVHPFFAPPVARDRYYGILLSTHRLGVFIYTES